MPRLHLRGHPCALPRDHGHYLRIGNNMNIPRLIHTNIESRVAILMGGSAMAERNSRTTARRPSWREHIRSARVLVFMPLITGCQTTATLLAQQKYNEALLCLGAACLITIALVVLIYGLEQIFERKNWHNKKRQRGRRASNGKSKATKQGPDTK